MKNENDTTYKMRKRDLVTGSILLVLSVAMILEARTYPLTESYGGVENAWYVSPALLPLIVAGLLLVLSIVLLVTAGLYVWRMRDEVKPAVSSKRTETIKTFSFIMLLLAAFIYLYIPSTDFLVTGILFLFLFIAAFYLPETTPKVPLIVIYLLMGLVLRISQSILPPNAWIYQYVRDWMVTLLYLVSLGYTFVRTKYQGKTLRKWVIVFVTSFIFMFLLVFSFKFGLRIPMPQEGFYCYQLDLIF